MLHGLFECKRCSIQTEPTANQCDTFSAASISDPLPPAPSITLEAPAAKENDDSTIELGQGEAANGCMEDPANR